MSFRYTIEATKWPIEVPVATVIVICGPKGSGKSTVAKLLQTIAYDTYEKPRKKMPRLEAAIDRYWHIQPMAAPLKMMLATYLNMSYEELDAVKRVYGKDLQELGALLQQFRPDFLAKLWVNGLRNKFVIVDDVRFPIEMERAEDAAEVLYKIWVDTPEEVRANRMKGDRRNPMHASEISIRQPDYTWDFIIRNAEPDAAHLIPHLTEIVTNIRKWGCFPPKNGVGVNSKI